MNKQKVIVSVTNDLTTDHRVHKICSTFYDLGFDVVLVGRKLQGSQAIKRTYTTKRMLLWFNKGAFFYANYNIRLFSFLLFTKYDVLWSNDLDTLLANHWSNRFRKKKLIFDSHEYYTEVPELIDRPKVRKIWKSIEKRVLPQLKTIFTVSPSIADLYKKEYNVEVKVLRNVPHLYQPEVEVPNIKRTNKKIILYQGAININRGIENMILAMHKVEGACLLLLGVGDLYAEMKQLIQKEKLEEKVEMLGQIPLEQLRGYTAQADLGLSLEEDKGLNYRLALPNKLFDYLHAGLPVLVANLPEMRKIVDHYAVGEIIEEHSPSHIAIKMNTMLNDSEKMLHWGNNAKKAAKELNWEKEKEVITDLF